MQNRFRPGLERLENRETPGAVNVAFPRGFVNVQWFRHFPWAVVHVTAPHTNVNVVGWFVRVGVH